MDNVWRESAKVAVGPGSWRSAGGWPSSWRSLRQLAKGAPARRRRARVGEGGAVSAELVVAAPLLMLLVLLVAQFALWAHATHIAQAAAAQALAATRASNGTTAAGTAEAEHVLAEIGGGPLRDP